MEVTGQLLVEIPQRIMLERNNSDECKANTGIEGKIDRRWCEMAKWWPTRQFNEMDARIRFIIPRMCESVGQ